MSPDKRGQLSLPFDTVPLGGSDDPSPASCDAAATMTKRARNLSSTDVAQSPDAPSARRSGSKSRDRAAGNGGVVPPSSKSMTSSGALKDTPANRALALPDRPAQDLDASSLAEGAFFADKTSLVLLGDVRATLRRVIASGLKVDCMVTSPPFYGQRDYGVEGQLGLEEHPQQYIDHLLEVFSLCREALTDAGSLWVNLGDTYWSGKGAHKSDEKKQGARRFGLRPQDRPGDGRWTKPKQLLLVPHRFAIAMQDAGWLVRNDNVWIKPNPVPDQVRDRCSISHEYVFHFTKERWYYFDQRQVARRLPNGTALPPLDTWVIPPSRGEGVHRASFSEELVRLPILATTPPGGLVLDPFNGSGTTMTFARRSGFRAIGIDLSREYCEQCVTSLKATQPSGQET